MAGTYNCYLVSLTKKVSHNHPVASISHCPGFPLPRVPENLGYDRHHPDSIPAKHVSDVGSTLGLPGRLGPHSVTIFRLS